MLSGSLPEKSNLPAVVYTEPAELAASSEMAKVTSRVSTRTLDEDDTNANVNNRQNGSRCNIVRNCGCSVQTGWFLRKKVEGKGCGVLRGTAGHQRFKSEALSNIVNVCSFRNSLVTAL